jgi:hypothetical protein
MIKQTRSYDQMTYQSHLNFYGFGKDCQLGIFNKKKR